MAVLVRKPAVAGAFYPADPEVLRHDLANYLQSVAGMERVSGAVIGLISPHAGYMYSGRVAAAAYHQLSGAEYDYVLVVSPSHHIYFQGASGFSYSSRNGIVINRSYRRQRRNCP